MAYNQLIRPLKSRLGLHYVRVASLFLDFALLVSTIVVIVSRRQALKMICSLLIKSGAEDAIVVASKRLTPLVPSPPPGSIHIVNNRD